MLNLVVNEKEKSDDNIITEDGIITDDDIINGLISIENETFKPEIFDLTEEDLDGSDSSLENNEQDETMKSPSDDVSKLIEIDSKTEDKESEVMETDSEQCDLTDSELENSEAEKLLELDLTEVGSEVEISPYHSSEGKLDNSDHFKKVMFKFIDSEAEDNEANGSERMETNSDTKLENSETEAFNNNGCILKKIEQFLALFNLKTANNEGDRAYSNIVAIFPELATIS